MGRRQMVGGQPIAHHGWVRASSLELLYCGNLPTFAL